MFSRIRRKTQNRIDTLIGAEAVINGDVDYSGGLRVDGCIKGNVNEDGTKQGVLVLSEHGRIEGAINVSNAIINGTVTGPIRTKQYVELQSKSKVTGDVCYKTLEIHVGAVIDGRLIYLDENAATEVGGAPLISTVDHRILVADN